MSVTLTIKNVPDDVARALRNRAAFNQRTLNEELLDLLRRSARETASVSIDGLLERSQRKKPALDETASSVLAAKDAEQQKTARRFEDLLATPDDPDVEGGSH